MAVRGLIIFSVLLSSLVASCYGTGLFKDLSNTLTVSTTPTGKVNLKAGKDQITVTWGLNRNVSKLDTSAYKQVEVKLCFLAESQVDRPWRKTEDELARDKTCQFLVVKKDFTSSSDSFTYTVKKDVPTAHYFVRVYVRDGPDGKQLAYGQTTGLDLSVKSISGRSASIDIAASIFSAFSVLSLAFFFYLEKKKARRAT
ncbi:high-affinity nitrate transporter 3.2-like [Chenopodium quinoa]|uniref:High-affinity nitrate transporter n=1 Tax=Chenopodium quinoa TaxID=63459 RepID=A0A803KQ92_CHEQI|nr:high-affinity nitrate transporter 3.2-like [Chenopodium quinoa]